MFGEDDTDEKKGERRRRGPRFDGGFMDVFEASRDLVCLCRAGRITAINQAGLHLLGVTSTRDVLDRPFAALAVAEDGGSIGDLLSNRGVQGAPIAIRLVMGERQTSLELRIFHAGEIAPDATVLIGHDTSREQQLAAAARESGQWFTAVVDNAMNLVCHVRDGRICYINAAGVAMLGAAGAEAVVGRPLSGLVHDDYAEMLGPDLIETVVEDGQAVPMRIRRDDGGMVDALVKLTGLPSRRGRELMVEARDITATNRAVRALKRSVETLEQRVQERTAELAREKEGVEHANRQLETANRNVSDAIRYASRIQTALLPEAGSLDGVLAELAIGWRPLDLVSGDYYWIERFGDKGVIALLDCTGHGVPGAFMTAVASAALARVLHHHDHEDPGAILTHLNRLVRAALRQDREGALSNDGLDAAICVVDAAAGRLRFAGARLPLLIWSCGEFTLVRGDRMSLGYVETPGDFRFTCHDIPLAAGDTCFLYTDGVTDQVGGPQRRLFGRSRLVETLEEASGSMLEDQLAVLFRRLDSWRGGEPRRDDMTFLAFRPRATAEQMAL